MPTQDRWPGSLIAVGQECEFDYSGAQACKALKQEGYKIKELNCDGIFTLSLLDVKAEQRYVPGTTTYAAGYAPYPSYGYYGGFYGYYSYNFNVISEPGYYTTDKTYFIEANLYDTEMGKIVFSMQSTALNPSSIDDFSKEYTWLLGEKLNEEAAAAKPGK